MHPILFRIPLPERPLMLWWALVAVAGIAVVYAILGMRRKDRAAAAMALLVAAGAGIAAYAFRETKYEAANLPIYSYGVMLGLSLVVGWYLTLTLAERDGLPKETMANCYVITAIAAIVGSRLLYVATNPDEFKSFGDIFALRRGGLVAYGGFLGGYLGSWLYLRAHKIRLMPWADVAVPSLASGLLITRIGCYLFGCDFGKRLPETAPAFLKKLGTFPHWPSGTLEGGDGAPAYVKHLDTFRGTDTGAAILEAGASLPVHPTQIYESAVGLVLLGILLWQRKTQRFRGQIFFLFAFAYGYLRFLLEAIRDDSERGEFGPHVAEHWMISVSLLIMGVAFVFGVSLGIKNAKARTIARVLAFVPPIVAFVMLKPPSFGKQVSIQLSTSQWIGLLTAAVVSYFYARFWETARKSPALAMGLESLGDIKPTSDDAGPRRRRDDDDDDDDDVVEPIAADAPADDAEDRPAPRKKGKKKGLKSKAARAEESPAADDASDETEEASAEEPSPEVVDSPQPEAVVTEEKKKEEPSEPTGTA
jgi:phosphatidylglycerol---prolipoprotein diacylglyceryl transferase